MSSAFMRQLTHQISVSTNGKGLYEITAPVLSWLREGRLETGLLTVYIRHTSASLTIQENADPDVIRDLEAFFSRLVPENDSLYRHTAEGPDDMPAHVRSALTLTQLSIPIVNGRPALGTWQGIYVFEHRRHAHRRTVVLHALGE
jgi:secondary thiamine-phosphate synthase enzyme